MDFSHYQYLFLHQTVKGAVASNGQKMDGEELPDLNAGKVYSGDIHVPQTIGRVEYVGSPYHVHFGDKFKARCVVITRDKKTVDLNFPCLNRITLDVDGVKDLEKQVQVLLSGDQVKIRVNLPESDKHNWQRIRKDSTQVIQEHGLELHGIELVVKKTRRRAAVGIHPAKSNLSPEEFLYRFVDADDLGGELLDIGLECLND